MRTGKYTIYVLDTDGSEMYTRDADTIKEAKRWANRLVKEPEFADCHKTEVRNEAGECLYDAFAPSVFK